MGQKTSAVHDDKLQLEHMTDLLKLSEAEIGAKDARIASLNHENHSGTELSTQLADNSVSMAQLRDENERLRLAHETLKDQMKSTSVQMMRVLRDKDRRISDLEAMAVRSLPATLDR